MLHTDIRNLTLPSGFELAPLPPPAILVVDDREENLFAMKKLLAKVDAAIVTASSGAEALALSLRQPFALILLDVQMPSMNGFEVAEYLRENEDTAHVPIIFLTAISKEERFVFQGYDSGAVDYIFKPVDPGILLAKVRVFLDLARHQMQLERLALVLSELNERHVRLLEAMNEGVLGFDVQGRILFANPMAQRLLAAPNQLVGQPLLPFLAGPALAPGEWPHHPLHTACLQHRPLHEPDTQMYRADGTPLPVEWRFGPFAPESGLAGGVLAFADISARKHMEVLRHRATYDELTGVPNRALFFDTLQQALARARRAQSPLALLYFDLDGFKAVNDRFGHAIGDELLKSFCQRCREILRAGDLLARLGGDEFVVLIEDAPGHAGLEALARKLCKETARAFEVPADDRRVHRHRPIAGRAGRW
jgi:diguanylate cyclase (GGDEF)-like protein/PAS domain S-box-containing protein